METLQIDLSGNNLVTLPQRSELPKARPQRPCFEPEPIGANDAVSR